MPSPNAHRSSAMRNTCTVAAILGFGVVTGALLAETSMMNFRLPSVRAFSPRPTGLAGGVNGYLMPAVSRGQSRRPIPQPRGIAAHHAGL